jgi:hypothetical protein
VAYKSGRLKSAGYASTLSWPRSVRPASRLCAKDSSTRCKASFSDAARTKQKTFATESSAKSWSRRCAPRLPVAPVSTYQVEYPHQSSSASRLPHYRSQYIPLSAFREPSSLSRSPPRSASTSRLGSASPSSGPHRESRAERCSFL